MRVATYNLYLGADLSLLFGVSDLGRLAETVEVVRDQLERTRFEERARAVASILARERPDLVGLQEVTRWTVAPHHADGSPGPETVLVDFLPALVEAMNVAGCAYDVHVVSKSFSGAMPVLGNEWLSVAGANVTLVRRGIEVTDEASATFAESLQLVTGIEGLSFPIVRGWSRVDVRVDGAPVRFVNAHTEAWDRDTRDAQRDELLALNGDYEGPVVLVGDFNAGPADVGMPQEWVDSWTLGEGDGFTCGQAADLSNAESMLDQRIDYVWVRGASVRACRVVGDVAADRSTPHGLWPSDHAGVVAELELG
ncbi:MAG: endonuclease/exonuclease/phosphatase family protein [Marmoricola sp.]